MTQPVPPPGPMQQPASWDSVAAGYAEETTRFGISYAETALELLAPERAARVLDVAAGPGPFAFLAAPRVASVTAVDFSPGMIEQVRARAARDGVSNLQAAVMDAQALALPDGAFDAACCLFAFMFFPDRARAFSELRRVLRPGGRALIATWAPIDRRPLMKIGFDAMAEAMPQMPPPAKGDLQTPGECIAEMRAAGFRDVDARVCSSSMRVTSGAEYADMFERISPPLVVLRARLGEAGWHAMRATFVAAVQARIPQGGTQLAAEAILTMGRSE